MVRKYQSPMRVYKYSFELIMAVNAYERSFPTCPLILIFIHADAPRLLKKICAAGVDYLYFMQKKTLEQRTLHIEAYNETFSSRVVFRQHYSYKDWTCFQQNATMDMKSFFGFESSAEKLVMRQHATNIKKEKEIIDYYLRELESQGTTHIPHWKPTSTTATSIPAPRSNKLDSDYKELSPLQESRLSRLYEHILQFLRSHESSVEKAQKSLCHRFTWRKCHQVDVLLDMYLTTFSVLSINEEGLKHCKENTVIFGTPVSCWTCLVDLEGFKMRHLWRPGIKALLRIIEVVEANYPETLGWLLLVRTLISPFIAENTCKIFLIYAGKDYCDSGGLVDYISRDFIPQFLGGNCPVSPHGKGQSSVVMEMRYKHCILIDVTEPSSVITWDLDMCKGESITAASIPAEGPLMMDRSWMLGQHYSMVEMAFIWKEGESIQGSHVTCSHQTSDHTCRVKYYTEVLQSATFRGSMTSLDSSHSCFSQLSGATSYSGQSNSSSLISL
uniref:SEC14-like lipid binding 1 n=1 Tax=Electrophorus electricus TaxID=8005 RepID=A0A4W4HET4_ELEEL